MNNADDIVEQYPSAVCYTHEQCCVCRWDMEKQEMEMKWKLEIKMERQLLSCCSPSKIHVLLAFIPDHPRALPSF